MFIKKLKIHNFRNLVNKEFEFSSNINLFHGENGVGKTSILESIKYLSAGKSFRKCSFKNLINTNSTEFSIFIELKDHPIHSTLAVIKDKSGKWKAKLDSEKVQKQSHISSILPVVSIDPHMFDLIDLGPSYRRSYLDWFVFHVKHDYLQLWKVVYKCIKHLNHLYKNGTDHKQMDYWEEVFIDNTINLNRIRSGYFDEIKPLILNKHKYMIGSDTGSIDIKYYPGWNLSVGLKEQLQIDRPKNLQYGQLQHGPHKMDLKILKDKTKAAQILSRGQKKILSMSFYMAYIELFQNHTKTNPIICLDDFDAELDDIKLAKASEFFLETGSQIFITTVNYKKNLKVFPQAQVFHVEHS